MNFFWWIVALHVLLWTVVPAIVRPNLPFDVIEGLAWGKEWRLGYQKHPPLAFWLLEAFYRFFLQKPFAPYLLSQLCIATAFFFA